MGIFPLWSAVKCWGIYADMQVMQIQAKLVQQKPKQGLLTAMSRTGFQSLAWLFYSEAPFLSVWPLQGTHPAGWPQSGGRPLKDKEEHVELAEEQWGKHCVSATPSKRTKCFHSTNKISTPIGMK